jgi:hypothetical protein
MHLEFHGVEHTQHLTIVVGYQFHVGQQHSKMFTQGCLKNQNVNQCHCICSGPPFKLCFRRKADEDILFLRWQAESKQFTARAAQKTATISRQQKMSI